MFLSNIVIKLIFIMILAIVIIFYKQKILWDIIHQASLLVVHPLGIPIIFITVWWEICAHQNELHYGFLTAW